MKLISFLRKYTLAICLLSVFSVLVFFLIPAQEKHYDHYELKIISKKVIWFSMGISFFMIILFWIFKVWRKEKWRDSLYVLVNLIFVAAFAGFFYLKVLFSFGGLLVNRIIVRERVIREYNFTRVNSDKNWFFLYDTAGKEMVMFEHLVNIDMLQHCDGSCKVKVMTKIGLFGWESDPKVIAVDRDILIN